MFNCDSKSLSCAFLGAYHSHKFQKSYCQCKGSICGGSTSQNKTHTQPPPVEDLPFEALLRTIQKINPDQTSDSGNITWRGREGVLLILSRGYVVLACITRTRARILAEPNRPQRTRDSHRCELVEDLVARHGQVALGPSYFPSFLRCDTGCGGRCTGFNMDLLSGGRLQSNSRDCLASPLVVLVRRLTLRLLWRRCRQTTARRPRGSRATADPKASHTERASKAHPEVVSGRTCHENPNQRCTM